MKTKEFFEKRLNAPLRNAGWSWGGTDDWNRVFLRVHKQAIRDDYGDGLTWALLIHPNWEKSKSNGFKERLNHIQIMRSGCEGFAVVYSTHSTNGNGKEKTKWFEKEKLKVLDTPIWEGKRAYSQVLGEIKVDRVLSQKSMTNDIEDLFDSGASVTERQSLIKSRIGQGKFRQDVLEIWDGRCAVTNTAFLDLIRASHIKPWSESTPRERLDKYNGLPLIANIDALFDRGWISFKDSGKCIISSRLDEQLVQRFQLNKMNLQRKLTKRTSSYMNYHRENVLIH